MNTKRALKIMDKYQLDALIASKSVNLKYLCNFQSASHQYIAGTEVYAVLPNIPGAKPTLIMPVSGMEMALDLLPYVDELVPYGRFIFYAMPGKKLSERYELVKKAAVDNKPIPTVLEAVASVLKKLGCLNYRIQSISYTVSTGIAYQNLSS